MSNKFEVTAKTASEAKFMTMNADCELDLMHNTEWLDNGEVTITLNSATVNGSFVEDLPFDNYVEFHKDAVIVYGAKYAGGDHEGNHDFTLRIPFVNIRRMTITNDNRNH